MVRLGANSQREIEDVAFTRYACYLLVQNGDPRKESIAFAPSYFAVQTRRLELIESETERSALIFERVGHEHSFARIRRKGDTALFGGLTTQQMKERLAVPDQCPLAVGQVENNNPAHEAIRV
jgi:DNA-damage-inducible protein D